MTLMSAWKKVQQRSCQGKSPQAKERSPPPKVEKAGALKADRAAELESVVELRRVLRETGAVAAAFQGWRTYVEGGKRAASVKRAKEKEAQEAVGVATADRRRLTLALELVPGLTWWVAAPVTRLRLRRLHWPPHPTRCARAS